MFTSVLTVWVGFFAHVYTISLEPRFCPDAKTREQIYSEVITTPAPESLQKVAESEVNRQRIDVSCRISCTQ